MQENDNEILGLVKRQELNLLKSFSWISLGIAVLYLSGYIWRCAYYTRMNVPVSMIDFPFPEILIPKLPLISFITNAVLLILSEYYSNFHIKTKRSYRAKAMGIDVPIDQVEDYGLQKNLITPDKTNFEVFYEFSAKYFNEKFKDDSEWKFDKSAFKKEVLKLLNDIPDKLEDAYIDYSLKLLIMATPELDQTLKDVIGFPPQGSKLFEKIIYSFSFFWAILLLISIIQGSQIVICSIIYAILGVFAGLFIVKMSNVEDRSQMWHCVLICLVVILILNGIDGYVTAGTNIKKKYLPVVKIIKTNGDEQEGLLLGSFSDSYIILPFDPNDIYKHTKIHKQAIDSISWTTVNRMNKEKRTTKNTGDR